MHGTVLEFRAVPEGSPPGTCPTATVQLDDDRTVEVELPSHQAPLAAGDDIQLWFNPADQSVTGF